MSLRVTDVRWTNTSSFDHTYRDREARGGVQVITTARESMRAKGETGSDKVLNYGDVLLRRSDVELLDGPEWLNDQVRCGWSACAS